jgi:hypothetical protein
MRAPFIVDSSLASGGLLFMAPRITQAPFDGPRRDAKVALVRLNSATFIVMNTKFNISRFSIKKTESSNWFNFKTIWSIEKSN